MKRAILFFCLVVLALVLVPLTSVKAQSSDYGDVNNDGSISVSDVVYLINYLFKGGSAPNPAFIGDCNGDDKVSVSDIVYLINYLFKGGPRPQNFYLPPDSSEIVYDSATGGYLVPNRIIVQFEDTTNLSIVNQLLSSINGQPVGEIRRLRTYEWEVADTNFAFQILRAHTAVVFAVPNYYTSFCVTKSSDPAFIGLQQNEFNLIRAPLAWDLGVGSNSVAIGIVDIGINPEHPDLQNRLTYRFGCTWRAGVNDHGTLVSGVAAAEVNNQIGIAGVTWANPIIVWGVGAFKEIKIGPLSIPLADPFGIGQGVEFINNYARNTLKKKLVISISTGLSEDSWRPIQDLFGAPMEAAIAAAYNDGCVIVSAAGNAGIEITKGGVFQGSGKRSYPASFWQVLAVGSVNLLDQRESYSDYGTDVIAVPGKLYTTTGANEWKWAQGTSLSAPMVAGICALIWSRHPELSNSDVVSILTVTADPAGDFGLGRANAWRAIRWADGDPVAPNKLPGEPTWKNPGGIPGDSKVTLQWDAPANNYDGTTPMDDNVTGYHIYRKLSSESDDTWEQVTPINAPWTSNEYADEGLTNGLSYDYGISAVDEGGQEGYQTEEVKSVTPQSGPVTAWVQRYNGPGNGHDKASAIAVDGSGNIYVTGYSVQSGVYPDNYDYGTIKYDQNGNQLWVQRYNGPGNGHDYAFAIAVDGSGNVYVTGYSAQDWHSPYNYDYATVKYDQNGNQLWVQRYNGPGNDYDYAYAIAVDGSGNVYVTGASYGGETTINDYATVKYGPSGNQLWVKRYDYTGPVYDDDWATGIEIDGSGNVYVTGYSEGNLTGYDYATVKYNSSGNQLWVKRYDGPVARWDIASAIAVDGSGNVYVTGYSEGNLTGYDYATVKYNSSGTQLWVQRYNGPGNFHDDASAIATDGSGNVYITGYSAQSNVYPYNYDYATIKYDQNGNQLWVQRYNGPGDSTDYAFAVAVDGFNNVYVTGTSIGSGSAEDYATIKYDPQGNELWVQRYNGPADSTDYASAIAVDGSDNVYVTGYSFGNETGSDYATIKYIQPLPRHEKQ